MSKLADNPPAAHKAGGGGRDGDGYTKEESWKISVTVPAVMVEKEPKNVLHYSLPEVDLTNKEGAAFKLSKENEELKIEVKSLSDQIHKVKEAAALEAVVYYDSQEKQQKMLRRMEEKVQQYRHRCTELEDKLDSAIVSSGADPSKLPSAVKQLERKVRELRGQKEEIEKTHMDVIKEVTEESERQKERALKLAASNLALQEQLQEAQMHNSQLHEEILTRKDSEDLITIMTKQQMEDMQERVKELARENQLAVDHKNNLTSVISETKKIKAEVRQAKQEVLQQLKFMANTMDSLSEKLRAEVSHESVKMKSTQNTLSDSLKKSEDLRQKLAEELESSNDDIGSLEVKIQQTVDSLEHEVEAVRQSSRRAEEEAAKATANARELGTLNAALKKQISELDNELQQNQEELANSQRHANTLHSALVTIVAMFAELNTTAVPGSIMDAPKSFGTPGDSTRLANWAITAVQQGVEQHCKTVDSLSQDFASLQESNALLTSQLECAKKEMTARVSAQDMLRRDVELCQSQLSELETAKSDLQVQLEETTSQRFEVEQTLVQCQDHLETVNDQKAKVEASCKQLNEQISNLQKQLAESATAEDTTQQELKKKSTYAQKVESQLRVCQEELVVKQTKISELHSEKLRVEHELNEMKLQVAVIEADRAKLQQELKEVQELHSTLTDTISELRKANNILESEKRSLMHSLDKVTDIQTRLDEENVALEKENMVSKDKLEQLRTLNRQLSGKVSRLDTTLRELDAICVKVQKERDNFKLESTALCEALSKTRLALTEVQIQRSRLNQYIAKVAQEKGELVQEKVKLTSQVAMLAEQVEKMDKQLLRQETEKTKLQEEIANLKGKIIKNNEDRKALEAVNQSLQDEKQRQMKVSSSTIQEKEERLERLQQEHTDEIKKVTLQGKFMEAELQGKIRSITAASTKQISELRDGHQREILELREQHESVVAQMKEETQLATKSHQESMIALAQEKDILENRYSSQIEQLEEVIVDLEKELQTNTEDLEMTKKEARLTQKELKNELREAQTSTGRLADEVYTLEQQLQMLHKSQDTLKQEAQEQISSLQKQLVSATNTIAQLEDTNQDITQALNHSEKCRKSLKRSLNEANIAAEQLFVEKQEAIQLTQDLQKKLNNSETELFKTSETCTLLQEALSMSNELQETAKAEVCVQRKQIQTTQSSLAALVSENATLQATLTKIQQESRQLEGQLKTNCKMIQKLERDKETAVAALSEMKHKVEILEANSIAKDKEKTKLLQLVGNLKEEKGQLQHSLNTVSKERSAEKEASEKQSLETEKKIEELKSQRERMVERIAALEVDIKIKKENNGALAAELSTLQKLFVNQEKKLKEVNISSKGAQASYSHLVSVLQGVLDLPQSVQVEENSEPNQKGVKDTSFSTSVLDSISWFTALEQPDTAATQPSSSSSDSTYCLPEYVKQAILKLQENLAASQHRVQSTTTDLKALQKRSEYLQVQKGHCLAELSKAQQTLAKLQATFDSESKRKKELEKTIAYQAKVIKEKNAQIQLLKEEGEKNSEEFDVICLETEVKEKQLKKCTEELQCLELEKESMQSKLKEKSTSIAVLEDMVENLQKEHEQFKLIDMTRAADMQIVQQELEATKETLAESERNVGRQQSELANLRKLLTASQSTQRRKEEDAEEFAKLVAFQESQRRKLETSLAEAQKEMEKKQASEELLENQVRVMVSKKIEADSKEKGLKKRVDELEKDLISLKAERNSLAAQLKAAKVQLQSHLQDEETVSQQKASLDQQVKQLKAHLNAEKVSRKIGDELCKVMQKEAERRHQELQHSKAKFVLLLQKVYKASKDMGSLSDMGELDETITDVDKHEKLLREIQSAQERKINALEKTLQYKTAQWEDKEDEYKKAVKHLEKKVKIIEAKSKIERK